MSIQSRYALPDADTIHRVTYDNGLTLLVYENPHVESVVLHGSLRAGSIYNAPEQNGLASLTAALLMGGTQSRDFDALNSALEDIGAELDYSVGQFRVTVDGRALAEDLPVLLDVLSDSLRHPVFPQEELTQEVTKRLTELNYAQQNTRYMAARRFHQALYPAIHPFHRATYGSIATLPTLSRQHVVDFHAQQYGADGMILILIGAVNPQEAEALVAQALGDWNNPQQRPTPELPPVSAPQSIIRQHVPIAGMAQTDIVMGTTGPSRKSADYRAATLANSILGEFAMMGRIGDVIREQLGLAYYAYSRIEGGEGPGAWHITIGTESDNVELAIEKARAEIQRIVTEPVSMTDLNDNQSYFTGRLPLRLESSSGLASALHTIERYDLGLDYLLRYHDLVYSLTPQDLLKAAQRYLHPDQLVIVTAGE